MPAPVKEARGAAAMAAPCHRDHAAASRHCLTAGLSISRMHHAVEIVPPPKTQTSAASLSDRRALFLQAFALCRRMAHERSYASDIPLT